MEIKIYVEEDTELQHNEEIQLKEFMQRLGFKVKYIEQHQETEI